jgi:uncharacterized protein UPF0489
MSCGEWLVPFKGRNDSGLYNQNFLWRDGSIYVMDNHRAAMWCWLQHVNPEQPHSLLHIDQHYDCALMPEWLENCPDDLRRLSVNEYLDFDYAPNDVGCPERMLLFKWDNYLSIYLARYGNSINSLVTYIHDDGYQLAPKQKSIQGNIWSVPGEIRCLDASRGPWIFNLDLDYFFWHDAEQLGLMVSDAYLITCFEKIREKIADQTIAVTTIALSPSDGLTGGWEPVERLAERVCRFLGIDFALPR